MGKLPAPLYNADIAICDYVCTNTNEFHSNESINHNSEIIEYSNIEGLIQLTGKRNVQFVVPWGKLYSKKLYDNIRYPEGKYHEDEFVCHKLIHASNKIVVTSEALLFYFSREDGITGKVLNPERRIHSIQALIERAFFLNNIGLARQRNKTIKSAVRLYKLIYRLNAKYTGKIKTFSLLRLYSDFYKYICRFNSNLKFKIVSFQHLIYLFFYDLLKSAKYD